MKKAGGRRQKAGGRRQKVFFSYRIPTPPEKEPPNFQFGGGLKHLTANDLGKEGIKNIRELISYKGDNKYIKRAKLLENYLDILRLYSKIERCEKVINSVWWWLN